MTQKNGLPSYFIVKKKKNYLLRLCGFEWIQVEFKSYLRTKTVTYFVTLYRKMTPQVSVRPFKWR